MKALVVNGSPRITRSITYRILCPLLEGMQAAGAETELIHLGQLTIHHCRGCLRCLTKTPAQCVQKDDMTGLLTKMAEADYIVYGTPLYACTMSGLMKDFVDRSMPLVGPRLLSGGDMDSRSNRFGRLGKIFLVSTCSSADHEHFASLVSTFKQIAAEYGSEYVGDILRPFSGPMASVELQELFQPYYSLVRQAGEQIIRQGHIDAALQADLQRDLFRMDKARMHDLTKAHWLIKLQETEH